jgi:hypothetical protein
MREHKKFRLNKQGVENFQLSATKQKINPFFNEYPRRFAQIFIISPETANFSVHNKIYNEFLLFHSCGREKKAPNFM